MIKKHEKIISATLISLILGSVSPNFVSAETGQTTFLSLYAGEHVNDSSGWTYADVDSFFSGMKSKGWTPASWANTSSVYRYGGYGDFAQAKDFNLFYWSGHGTYQGKLSHYIQRNYDTSKLYNQYPNTEYFIQYNDSRNAPVFSRLSSNGYQDGPNYISYNSSSGYYTDSYWNNKLNWVILAACYQLQDSSTRNKWALTMAGSHRVKGIMGYRNATGPVGPTDTNIANKFIDLAFNSTSKRTLYAWLQANAANNKSEAAALYHSINKNDTLTAITDNSKYTVPTFRLMYNSGSTIYEDIIPFSATSSATIEIEDKLMLEKEDTLSLQDDIKVKQRFSNIKFDNNNQDDVVDKVTNGLAGNILPDDATIDIVYAIDEEDVNELNPDAPKNTKRVGYILKYKHKYKGVDLSTNENGDYVTVSIDNEGIYSIEKKWHKIDRKSSFGTKADIAIDKSKAVEIANNYVLSNLNGSTSTDLNIKKVKLAYAKSGSYYVPVWEIFYEKSNFIQVNAIDGSIVFQ